MLLGNSPLYLAKAVTGRGTTQGCVETAGCQCDGRATCKATPGQLAPKQLRDRRPRHSGVGLRARHWLSRKAASRKARCAPQRLGRPRCCSCWPPLSGHRHAAHRDQTSGLNSRRTAGACGAQRSRRPTWGRSVRRGRACGSARRRRSTQLGRTDGGPSLMHDGTCRRNKTVRASTSPR